MSIETAGGANDTDIQRGHLEVGGRHRYIEGRRFRVGTFPPRWGEPPTLTDSAERRAWITACVRADTGQRDVTKTTGANTPSEARAALDLLAQRDQEQRQMQYQLDHWHEPMQQLARAALRDLHNARYAELIAKRHGPTG